MKLSGFSFVRDGIKLYYPVVESIKSILPIVDEFVIAVATGDDDDTTREQIAAIGDPKVKIIDTTWNEKYFKKGVINAIQTNIAKQACTGDWLFYLQADEVVHEKYLPIIKSRCEELLDNDIVEGVLFQYKHFWGDYNHYHSGHGWYPNEIRIIRNRPDIYSWQSAQSFRRFDFFDNPRQETGHHKLKVAKVAAEIYHYGWVRPPHLMQNKRRALDSVHWGSKRARDYYEKAPKDFDYGPLNRLAVFKGTHPNVMLERIAQMDWKDKLQYSGRPNPYRAPHKHERLKYRLLSWIEQHLMGGRQIGGFRNYQLLQV
jgi:glycosyltransferase involved in cell wall biosynthesis